MIDASAEEVKPSAMRAARSNATSDDPPSQIGIGRVGFGLSDARSIRWNVPLKSTTGSVNSPRRTSICSSYGAPASSEVIPECLVFDVVPSNAHAQPQSAARQKIDVGRLPGDKRCLALRQHHDARGEANPLRDAGQIGEHHKWIVERIKLGVWTRQRPLPISVDGAKHVIVRKQMVEAQPFHRQTDLPNSRRIPPKLGLRVHNADLHPGVWLPACAGVRW